MDKVTFSVLDIMAEVAAKVGHDPSNSAGLRERVEREAPPLLDLPPKPTVPERFHGATLDSYEPRTASQQVGLKATRLFCQRVREGESVMLALIGATGTGKSHLLYGAAHLLHTAGVRVVSAPWYRLADELRYGGPSPSNPAMRMEPQELREQIMGEKVLMIDEVRPTAGTAFDDTELAKIICNAWDRQQWVFITTNVSPLTEVVGVPLASRFTQIVITGPDGRHA